MKIKQSFHTTTLTRTKVTNNIIRCYNKTSANHRTDWYKEAYDYCEELGMKYNIPTFKIVGIVSALSPMKSWGQNKTLAEEFIKGRRSGTFSRNISKALSILNTSTTSKEVKKVLNGPKTVAFFENIYNYNAGDHVTVDRHAIEIACNYAMEESMKSLTGSQYEFFKGCYKRAAKKLNLRPNLVQSATWVYWREGRRKLKVITKEDLVSK